MTPTVQEAREALTLRHILDEIHSHFMRVAREVGNSEALLEVAERQWTETADAYAAAARAEERARMLAVVEGMSDVMMGDGRVIEDTVDREELLAALTGADK